MRIWIKEIRDCKPVRDTVIEDLRDDTRTHKIYDALDKACVEFDLGTPIWLEKNIQEFKGSARTKFYADSFIETIDFDYLELTVLEEDSIW